ncbi:aldehyde dehydrogenase family protein [Verrucomicrobiota bacterium sgz303538]
MKRMSACLLIANHWIDTKAKLAVIDPFTGAEFAHVPLGDEKLLDSAIAAAEQAYAVTRRQASHTRAALLEEVAKGIERRREKFVHTIVCEAGKPIIFAEAEVNRAILTFRTAADEARRQHGELLDLDAFPSGDGHFGLARRFPIGVIGAITPFNFPLNLVAHKVAPCIATGNTMVLKPATKTPLSALLLGKVLVEAGMPAGQVNIVTCTNEAAAKLIHDERVKKITFTGSPAVGWKLKEQCGKKRITLELGGNAGVILHDDADLDAAVPAVALGAFGSAGQSCISVQRVLVHESLYETFKQRLLTHIREKIKTGDPHEHDTIVGPIVTPEALAKIRSRLDQALASGAKILHGGQIEGNCLKATVLENVAVDAELCAEEAFAPVLILHSYRDFDDALRFVNDSRYGLQAGVFTRDLSRAFRAFEVLDVGGVMINQVPTWRVENMPYGGIKDSGFGREGVRYAMEEMTELKSLIIKNAANG